MGAAYRFGLGMSFKLYRLATALMHVTHQAIPQVMPQIVQQVIQQVIHPVIHGVAFTHLLALYVISWRVLKLKFVFISNI